MQQNLYYIPFPWTSPICIVTNVSFNFLKSVHTYFSNILPGLIWIWIDMYEICAKKDFWKEHLCALQVS